METVFSRFDSYNFEADQRFVNGLTSYKSDRNGDKSELLNLKLFFYNRFVEPIDQRSYKERCSSSPGATASGFTVEHLETPAHHPDMCGRHLTETSGCPETKQLSFAEVMQLVQEGKEVPGASKLDIKPSNQSPTPAQMQRVLKPWETASS